ncbi:AraC family transcriptional regulator [Sorangium sp. So ce1078]|uniref:AraC family transcriptional regulator n=1 Tax=Sorangium sp. So ce1078 TaxID=3133329 RepID=UPI003F5F028E
MPVFPSRPTVSTAVAGRVISYATSRGLRRGDLLAIAGLSAESLTDADARIPVTSFDALWAHVVRTLDDPGVPIHVAARTRMEEMHVMGFAVMTSESAREALDRVDRYMVLLADTPRWETDYTTDPGAPFAEQHRSPRFTLGARVAVECSLAMHVRGFRQCAGVEFSPLRVTFRHAAPRDLAAHRDFFRCPLEFGAPRDGYAFPASLLEVVPRDANPALSAFFFRHAEDLRRRRAVESARMSDQVGAAVAHLLASGEPSASVVARQLGTSERTLRRHLEEEGTTFRQIVGEVRRRTAEELLRESDTSMSEIAFLLGFSEVTAFARAFKRWSGRTPGQLREEARGGRALHAAAAVERKADGG